MRIKLVLLAFFTFSMAPLLAQTWEAGVFGGVSGYMGDINPRKFYQVNDMAYGLQLKRNFDGYWSAKLNLMQGTIAGDDGWADNAFQQQRNLSFYSPLTEASLQVEFNFFKYLAGVSRVRITPFLFTGIGGVMFNPKRKVSDGVNTTTYSLNDFHNEGQTKNYQTRSLTVPYGFGVKYNIRGSWNLIGEVGYRTAFTDYLDDVSQNYPNDLSTRTYIPRMLSDPSGVAIDGTQRGDYRKRDTYLFAGLSLTFTFVSRKCPVVDN